MADLMFVFVQEDTAHANALADMFYAAGITIDENTDEDALDACSAAIIVWSHAAARCRAFLKRATEAARAGKAVIAHLGGPVWLDERDDAPVVHLWNWDGVSAEDPALDRLLFAVDERLAASRAELHDLAPAYIDAVFEECAPIPEPDAFWVEEAWPRAALASAPTPARTPKQDEQVMGGAWTAPLPSDFIVPRVARPAPNARPPRRPLLAVAARAMVLAFMFGAGALVGNLEFGRGGMVAAQAPAVTLRVASANAAENSPQRTERVVPTPRRAASSQIGAPSFDTAALTIAETVQLAPLALEAAPALLEMTTPAGV